MKQMTKFEKQQIDFEIKIDKKIKQPLLKYKVVQKILGVKPNDPYGFLQTSNPERESFDYILASYGKKRCNTCDGYGFVDGVIDEKIHVNPLGYFVEKLRFKLSRINPDNKLAIYKHTIQQLDMRYWLFDFALSLFGKIRCPTCKARSYE